ncbi:hypothetical protein FRC01_008332 [Tulasnella sp. 417]|nr:hypothetical protein FRC01_008332 [Tulasnella sp. 417]
MQFRMLVLERAAQKSGRRLRQMFVTQSRMLANRVQQYWIKLQQNEDDTDDASQQKFSSFSLLDLDEGAEEDVLPSKFSELDDSHFPLFLTYNQLCKLLEADYGLKFNPSTNSFMANFSPANVYGEFLGVIKGSEAAFNSSKHQLDRQTYETQSIRTHAGDYSERSRVYTLFEAYMKKRPSGSYDMADRAHAIIAEVQENGVPGRGIDFLYVDEAQDHLMVDVARGPTTHLGHGIVSLMIILLLLLVLRSLCQNPHGLFFAGDTAQTISLGSTFRFSELKAFLYRLEVCDQKPMFMLGTGNDTDFLRLVSGTTGGNVQLGAHQGK